MKQLEVQARQSEGGSTWGTIQVGEGRLQVRHFVLWLGVALWLLPIFCATSVHGIAWFAFNLTFVAVLTLVSSMVRTVPLHKLAICFLGGGLASGLALLIEQPLVAGLGHAFPLRHMITVPLEELAKLAVVVFMLWRGRRFSSWSLGATDILLMGTAAGAGFAFAEDSFRHFSQPGVLSNLSVLMPASELINGRVICGHAVWAGLSAGTLGLAMLFSHRKEFVLPCALFGLLLASFDHLELDMSAYPSAFPWLQSAFKLFAFNGWSTLGVYVLVLVAVICADHIVSFGNLPRTKEFKFPRRKDRKEPLSSLWDCVIDVRRLNFAFYRYRHYPDDAIPAPLAITVALLAKRLVNRYMAVEPAAGQKLTMGDTMVATTAQEALQTGEMAKPTGFAISPFEKRPLKDLLDLPDCYELQDEAFRGGMGIILRATHKHTGANLAVKILHPHLAADPTCLLRFEQEAKAASQLKHPNIVSVHDYGITPSSTAYLVMEWLDGTSLERAVRLNGPLSGLRFTNVFTQTARALSHAHRKGVVHRDIKPSNIVLTIGDANTDLVKICDFGIAKVLRSDDNTHLELTGTGDLLGSPYFMSPEQCTGDPIDNRSDIYSLGCVMYEALCGKPPFTGSNPAQVFHKHIHDMPTQPRAVNPEIIRPELYERMLFKCLQKDPDKRYMGMDELEQELKNIGEALRQG